MQESVKQTAIRKSADFPWEILGLNLGKLEESDPKAVKRYYLKYIISTKKLSHV